MIERVEVACQVVGVVTDDGRREVIAGDANRLRELCQALDKRELFWI